MTRILLVGLLSIFATSTFGATFTPLGYLPGGTSSYALGVSDVGSVAVGWSQSTEGQQAFRWTPSGGIIGLGDLPAGAFNSFATDVSADGSVVVGTGRAAPTQQAFRWTSTTGMVSLGSLDGSDGNSSGEAVSPDGNIIVGTSQSAGPTNLEAYRWTPTG
jgi:probable HAF family extracellular repeat protein